MSVPNFPSWRSWLEEFKRDEIARAEKVLAETGNQAKYQNMLELLDTVYECHKRLIDHIEERAIADVIARRRVNERAQL